MKKFLVLCMGLCVAFAFTSCKSSESAYKKAYEKAKAQELTEAAATQETTQAVEAAPVQQTVSAADATYRSEKVSLVSGSDLKAYSIVCGSFGVKANAENLKEYLDNEGYDARIAYNSDRNMYRVICDSYDDRSAAAQFKESFKAKYPSRQDFQGAWLLYNK
ncbi:MAG: SPOR domain-containing protein [Phocaeicola sp.]|uniref:SPOR domain-containing protein n=1 Tax=Phocaeicola TaxID=909656 RepID=UPI00234F5796|nr:SPOR domain-containing protein [Phocaeicola oris]MCE2617613.1 SPOR domain-containing protein [Phocaeicola oris]